MANQPYRAAASPGMIAAEGGGSAVPEPPRPTLPPLIIVHTAKAGMRATQAFPCPLNLTKGIGAPTYNGCSD
jgi:hypothetical protein